MLPAFCRFSGGRSSRPTAARSRSREFAAAESSEPRTRSSRLRMCSWMYWSMASSLELGSSGLRRVRAQRSTARGPQRVQQLVNSRDSYGGARAWEASARAHVRPRAHRKLAKQSTGSCTPASLSRSAGMYMHLTESFCCTDVVGWGERMHQCLAVLRKEPLLNCGYTSSSNSSMLTTSNAAIPAGTPCWLACSGVIHRITSPSTACGCLRSGSCGDDSMRNSRSRK
mmetsp:Transcript_7857/g.20119  ORF Transcript_7857/g.20119 Transcript_7857/m.20119 type:complete len:227 (+) Transcript_7857:526-1206(+)